MSQIKYTFLLPAFKGVYFATALNSIKSQKFTNFKVIVSDDCSKDNLKEIYDSVVGPDSRFIYRRNIENIGGQNLVAHWNLLLSLCDTNYLILASDDDVYDSNFLEEIDKLIDKYPDVNLFRSRVASIDAEDRILFSDVEYNERVDCLTFAYDYFCRATIHCIPNFVFKKQALINNNGFIDLPLAWFADDVTALINSSNGVVNTHDVLFKFRTSRFNISNSKFGDIRGSVQKVKASRMFWEIVNEEIKKYRLNNQDLYSNVKNGIKIWVFHDINVHKHNLPFADKLSLFIWLIKYRYITGIKTNKYFWSGLFK